MAQFTVNAQQRFDLVHEFKFGEMGREEAV